MAEDRMLNDEILLGLIKSNSGGGGGGTTNYNSLSNKPQIAGTELQGNKSLADLGIASAQSVEDITNGESINNFAGVETALSGKQNTLTAGDYIDITSGEISVNREIPPNNFTYEIVTKSTGNDDASMTVKKYANGSLVSSTDYLYTNVTTAVNIDGYFTLQYANGWKYTLLQASTDHASGYVKTWGYQTVVDYTEAFPTEDTSGLKLIIKSELDTALATKQNATDNSLDTDAKTIVGAINEHEGDIDSLKSGLTNLDNEVNGDATTYPYADVITIEDAVPANVADCNVKIEPDQNLHGFDHPWVGGAGKNKLPLVLADLKTANTDGTWNDNVYTINNGTITVNTDDGGNVTSIKANGTFNANTRFWLAVGYANTKFMTDGVNYTINGCPDGGSSSTYKIQYSNDVDASVDDVGSGATFQRYADTFTGQSISIVLYSGAAITNVVFYPMIRLATETDATFAPYTNMCPISGHTEAVVTRTGKNLADWNINIPSYALSIYLKPGIYTISGKENLGNGNWYFRFTDNNGAYISDDSSVGLGGWSQSVSGWFYGGGNNQSQLFIVVDNCKLVEIGKLNADGTIPAMLNAGNTVLPYVPYFGKTYTLALGDTIYGGTVDFDSGVMTVDRAIAEYDGSEDEEWTAAGGSASGWAYSVPVSNIYTYIDNLNIHLYKSNLFKFITSADTWGNYDYFISKNASANNLVIGNKAIGSVNDLRSWLSNNHLQVVYLLYTPTTIQLTPQQIQLLQGQNTIYASTGQISVTVNGVSGAIGAVQEQVNELEEEVEEIKPMDYSTDEQDTGLKWVDGKKIYRKTFASSGGTYTSPISIAHGISNIETVVDKNGSLYYGSTYHAISIDHAEPGNSVSHSIINSDNIVLNYGSDYSGVNAISKYDVTLYYTKTT